MPNQGLGLGLEESVYHAIKLRQSLQIPRSI